MGGWSCRSPGERARLPERERVRRKGGGALAAGGWAVLAGGDEQRGDGLAGLEAREHRGLGQKGTQAAPKVSMVNEKDGIRRMGRVANPAPVEVSQTPLD